MNDNLIIQFLKDNPFSRICYLYKGERWLCVKPDGNFIVYADGTESKLLYQGEDLSEALKHLKGETE